MTFNLIEYQDSPQNRAELFRFYTKAYSDSPWLLDEKRFEWQTLKNPLKHANESDIWLLKDLNSRIVGQNIFLRYPLCINQKRYIGICSTNLIVLPELIGKGFGHALIQQNENLDGVAFAVGITPASTRAFQKRGWVLIEDAKLFSRFLRVKPNLKYVNITGLKSAIACLAIAILNRISDVYVRFRRPAICRDVSVRRIDSFDPTWDKIWESYLNSYAIHFRREADFLNYKYSTRDDIDHNILLFERGDTPIGYLVCRKSVNRPRGIKLTRIVDIVCDPEFGWKLPAAMIRAALDRMKDDLGDGIVGVSSEPDIMKAFKANGMYLSRMQPAIIKEQGFTVSELRSRYKCLWYITLGDSDLDNYW